MGLIEEQNISPIIKKGKDSLKEKFIKIKPK